MQRNAETVRNGESDLERKGEGAPHFRVALLTGGGDKPYALGLASALIAKGLSFDFIGSDDVNSPDFHDHSQVRFLNLRGNQREDVSVLTKVLRVLTYYGRLLRYTAKADPKTQSSIRTANKPIAQNKPGATTRPRIVANPRP